MDERNVNDEIAQGMSYLYSLSPPMMIHEEKEEQIHLVDTVDIAAAAVAVAAAVVVPVAVNKKCRMPLLLMILLL